MGGDWTGHRIRLVGRVFLSGAYCIMKSKVLGRDDFSDQVDELPGTVQVVEDCGADRFSLGFTGLSWSRVEGASEKVRPLSVSRAEGGEPVPPIPERVRDGTYPLSRPLLILLRQDPKKLDAPTREFLRFVWSKEGQEIVAQESLVSLSSAQAASARRVIE